MAVFIRTEQSPFKSSPFTFSLFGERNKEKGGHEVPPAPSFLLLFNGADKLLLVDGSSKLELA